MSESIGITKNNKKVFVDLVGSHAATHIAKNPKLLEYVKSLLPKLEPSGEQIRESYDMGEKVGDSGLVETSPEDEIVYALRPNRSVHSRFVKNRSPEPTTWITIDLRKVDGDSYDLYTVHTGQLTPSFPGGVVRPEESWDFWARHALVWGSQEIIPGSVTKDCPWKRD